MSVLRRSPAHSNIGAVLLVFAIVAALYFTREILIPLAVDICTKIDTDARRIDVIFPDGLRDLNRE